MRAQNEKITTLKEELESVKKALFNKSQDFDAKLEEIAQLHVFIDNLKKQQVRSGRNFTFGEKQSFCLGNFSSTTMNITTGLKTLPLDA